MKKNIIIVTMLILGALGAGFLLKSKLQTLMSAAIVTEGKGEGKARIGGDFTLIDTTGNTVMNKDFNGKLMLVYLGFSHCPDICPTDLAVISEVMAQLKEDAEKLQPIFITIDPERDTPERLNAFMKHFDSHILALTGTETQTKAVEVAYKVYSSKVVTDKKDGNYMMDHSAFMYLMGKDGEYITHFQSGESAEKIVTAVKTQM